MTRKSFKTLREEEKTTPLPGAHHLYYCMEYIYSLKVSSENEKTWREGVRRFRKAERRGRRARAAATAEARTAAEKQSKEAYVSALNWVNGHLYDFGTVLDDIMLY